MESNLAGTADSTLASLSHKYWRGKTDGMHRHSEEEWFQKYAAELLAMLPLRGTLLDVGCGSCQVTTYLAQVFEHVYAFDFSETMLSAGQERIKNLGLTNIDLLSGRAQEFPKTAGRSDVILSYGVIQYLTLADLVQHLRECHRLLTDDGIVCAALIPNVAMRESYYRSRLVPAEAQFASRLRRWLRLTRRRLKGYLDKDPLWDGIGNWFRQSDIQQAARDVGFEAEFRNSWFYEYRFHALLRPKTRSLR
jgi:ubiquinone/menaquinone biosynthesis C-methylase UbiE